MAVTLSLFAGAGAQFFDNNGNPLTGGKIYTYNAGTTTPFATYTTNSDASFHTNPIVLDSAGRVPSGGEIWLQLGVGYKFVVKTSAEVLIATYDNIPSSAQPPAANDADSIMYEQGYTVTAGSFVVGKIYRIVSVGTTNFTLIGATANSVGLHFIATGVGSGTGTAELSQTVETKLRQTVSVKDFGAVGDGVVDDTAAIQAAVNASSVVEFPAGEYLISANINLPASVALIGAGYEFVTIKATVRREMISAGGTSPSNGNNLFVKGLTFSGVAIVLKDYIEQLNVFASYFTSGAVAGNTYNAIVTDAPTVETYTKIQNAEIANCTFYDVRRAIYLFRGFDYVNIHDNYIDTAAQNGMWISSYQVNNDLSYSVTANISNNTIKNVGGNANEAYISAIDLYAVNSVVSGNRIENVKNVNYWEVDGIYVKGQYSVISNNQIVNGGYRSNIQTKQMGEGGGVGLNNGQIPAQSIVISNNSIYMDETSGYAGAAAGVFSTLSYAGKVFGGINIVTDNTLVTGNYIYGAGTGIYAVNSYTLWLVNNVTISNNTIAANRGAAAILWGCAGQNITISRNNIVNPTNAFSMNRFYGLYIYFDDSYFLPRGSTASWIAANADYDLRRIRNLSFTDNIVNVSLSVSNTVRGLSLAVSDSSMGGGDVLVNPGSFDNVVVKGNAITALNAGAGDGYGFYAVDENDRYPNLNFDVSTNIAINATTANFRPPTGYVQTLRMNNYRLWVDPSSGDLYIKNGVPANNTDGTVVGTQT